MLLAVDFLQGPSYEVVIAGVQGADDTKQMLRRLRRPFLPRKVVILRPSGREGDRITALAGYTESHSSLGGRATADVCRYFACRLPTTDPETMLAELKPGALARTAGGRQ